MSVRIPASLVPRAPVDYDAESRQILGQDLVLSDGFRIPPLTPARLIALELVSSAFFLHPESCAWIDAAAAIVLATCKRSLVAELTRPDGAPDTESRGVSAFPALDRTARAWLDAHREALEHDYAQICAWLLVVPFYGFSMRPGRPGGSAKYFFFDGEFVGAVIAPAAKLLATPVEFVLWETPLCTVGHAIAQQDASLGVNGVVRPPDIAALDRMTAEAEAREKAGQLHFWQYMDPVNYPLTDAQANANPALVPLFAQIREAFTASGCRPVDPAKFPVRQTDNDRELASEASSSPLQLRTCPHG